MLVLQILNLYIPIYFLSFLHLQIYFLELFKQLKRFGNSGRE